MSNKRQIEIVSIFDKGSFNELREVKSGGYTTTDKEVSELVTDLIEAGKPVNNWSLWIDELKLDKPLPIAAFKKLKTTHNISLITVYRRGPRGSFPAPVLRCVDKKAPAAVQTAKSTTRVGR